MKKINRKINKKFKDLTENMKIDYIQIKELWPKKLPTGIIHCDLFLDNIFFYKRRFHGFIDFYFSSNDFYPIAVLLSPDVKAAKTSTPTPVL